jgi:hypothetical protein
MKKAALKRVEQKQEFVDRLEKTTFNSGTQKQQTLQCALLTYCGKTAEGSSGQMDTDPTQGAV